ncbi:alpha-N-acetylglucosaminidase C-terminal domain-containing protein, partial [Streptomyces sp. NPDC058812]|uniref:alpha-N-acetylglucosaminidase C-terminal domain-containing protein n=1 Tax=Streptomyces sp. NPDC058812 TaxID=3346639 RepID=UPI00369043BC
GFLHDYANREWSGLVSELYARRWAAYFAALDEALVRKAQPREIDWHAFEEEWARRTTRHPDRPGGVPHRLAAAVAAALPPAAAG